MRAVCCCHAELWVCLSFLCSLLLEGQLLLEVCRWGGRAVIKRSISASVGARNVNHSGVLLRVTLAFWLACQLCRSQSYLLNEIHLKWMGLFFVFFHCWSYQRLLRKLIRCMSACKPFSTRWNALWEGSSLLPWGSGLMDCIWGLKCHADAFFRQWQWLACCHCALRLCIKPTAALVIPREKWSDCWSNMRVC